MSNFLNEMLFKAACFRFKGLRGQFYFDLSKTMEVAKGKNLKDILNIQAGRHKGSPTGILCAHWLHRLNSDAGTFSEAVKGTIPFEDQVLLEVCEESGDLAFGLRSLGNNLLALKETIKDIQSTSALAITMVVIFIVYCFAQAFYLLPEMFKNIASSVDIHKLGETTDAVLTFMDIWQKFGAIFVVGIGIAMILMFMSLKKYVGGARRFLDKHFLPYQLYRAFNGALFMSTLAVITQKIGGNKVVALKSALVLINESAYPWLKWQTDLIISNLEGNSKEGGEIFNTGLMDKRTFYRVLDMSDYTTDTALLMTKVSDIVLEETPVTTKQKAQRWRLILQVLVLGLMLSFYLATQGINSEFTLAMEMANVS
ncbi:hypothetical protein [Undibacterium sp.]|uniref:hypothetical protein n=1 Tax=Undibacterium sp. TaxID=1914977 RepID=UPI003753AA0D